MYALPPLYRFSSACLELHKLTQCGLCMCTGSLMDVLYFTPDGAYRDESTGLLPTLPVPVNYPQSAAFTILTLEAPDYRPIVSMLSPQHRSYFYSLISDTKFLIWLKWIAYVLLICLQAAAATFMNTFHTATVWVNLKPCGSHRSGAHAGTCKPACPLANDSMLCVTSDLHEG